MSRLSATAAVPALPILTVSNPGRMLRLFKAARALSRQRRDLARLDAARLADIGISAVEAHAEARRPFWDAPRHWR